MDTSLTVEPPLLPAAAWVCLAMAKHFYSAGAKVAILADAPEPLEQAASDIAQQPGTGEVAHFACDVTDPEAVIATHKSVVKALWGSRHFGEQCWAIRRQTLHPDQR